MIGFKTQIAVGENTYQKPALINHRNAADAVFFHQTKRIGYCRFGPEGYGINDHSGLRAFYRAHLFGLICDAHVLVDHAYSTLPGNSNGQVLIRHGIHGGRYHRDV